MHSSQSCCHSGPVVITVADQAPLSALSGVLLFHWCGKWSVRRKRWWSCLLFFFFLTSCISSHSFVVQGLPVCVLWPWHEGLCWNSGEISGTELDKRTSRFPLEDVIKKNRKKIITPKAQHFIQSPKTTFSSYSFFLRWSLMHISRWSLLSH